MRQLKRTHAHIHTRAKSSSEFLAEIAGGPESRAPINSLKISGTNFLQLFLPIRSSQERSAYKRAVGRALRSFWKILLLDIRVA